MALLNVKKLNISVNVPGGTKKLVNNVSFEVNAGEILGIVGASGSGKSLSSMAIAGILNEKYAVESEEILFDGRRMDLMSEKELSSIRGKEIAYIFQEPMTSLNPLLTIENQVREPLRIHRGEMSTEVEEKEAVCEALKNAGLEPTKELLNSYPHQLSGGQRQRVMIAMAFICKPQLLVADEITTALDVDTRDLITELLLAHRKEYNTAIIFISHDRKLVRSVADRIIYMKNGEIQEKQGLDGEYEADLSGDLKSKTDEAGTCDKVILKVNNLHFAYVERNIFGKEKRTPVLQNVTLELHERETLGIVGRSGSGKSTLMKVITGLQQSKEGEVVFAKGYERPQMVFQDPYGSLNPSKTVGKILLEALKLSEKRNAVSKKKEKKSKQEMAETIFEMLKSVDLNSEIAYRRISELSGGQRQRIAIACALIGKPGIVILDEPVSAVDAEVQGQILKLLAGLRRSFGCSYIMISHDPEVIAKTCDRVMVLEDGTLKERER